MPRLSERERIAVLMMVGYGDRLRTHEEACDVFNAKYPEKQISTSTVSRLVAKYDESGSVADLPRSGRPSTSNETKLNILLEIEENHHLSTRQLALNHNVSQTSVVRLLKKEKYHPYKVQLIHELNEDDPDRRLQFCEQLMALCDGNPNFLKNIVFSDEATFSLKGTVHRHNCRYWSPENPHWTQEAHTQRRGKVNVWAGMIGDRLLGPFFFLKKILRPQDI